MLFCTDLGVWSCLLLVPHAVTRDGSVKATREEMVSVSHEVPQQLEPIAVLKVKSNLIKASKGASGNLVKP